jgi:hypothetical protein
VAVTKRFFPALLVLLLAISSCELYTYGKVGGADVTSTITDKAGIDGILNSWRGVWYSHDAGIGRLDGYRIGKWSDFNNLDFNSLVVASGKDGLFPLLEKTPYATYATPPPIDPDDYFVLYDDTVYGQFDDSDPPQPSWGFAYIGIVRAINIFNGDKKRGALIIEYLKGAAPQWEPDIKDGQLPFVGIYYRQLNSDTIQMANPVDLAAQAAGDKKYTEKATLAGAIALNTVENEAEFISWGVVIPQDREP